MEIDNAINKLLNSAIDFRKGNEEINKLIIQLYDVLKNIENTMRVIENKYYEIRDRRENINPEILEKFLENIENISKVVENVKLMVNNLESSITKNEESIIKLCETIEKLKNLDKDKYNMAAIEYEKINEIVKFNKGKLLELKDLCESIEDRIKEILLDIENTLK